MLLIVGIGASAGGLDAVKAFLANTPPDTGMAFVLVQHPSPDHKGMLAELLHDATTMSVIEVADGMEVKPDCVFVIPPEATMSIESGCLEVVRSASPHDRRGSIDIFFESLATDQGECAVAILLSGTGSDGTRGMAAVKDHGGLTLAQAEFDSRALPGISQSAAATDLVDGVLTVEAMPTRLTAYRAQSSCDRISKLQLELLATENQREAGAAALIESRADLRLLIDSVADAIYCVDRKGATTLCNAVFLKILGFDAEIDVIDIKLHDVIHHSHPDGSPYLKSSCPIYRTARTGEPAHVTDEFFFRVDGSRVPVEYWVRPIVRNGELQGAICTFVDVSERRAAEAALRENEQQFRALADAIPQLTWIADADGAIYWYNQRWFDYTGTDLEAMKDWGWREVHHPDHIDRIIEEVQGNWAAGKSWEGTYQLRSANGEYRRFLTRAEPIRNEAGELVRWFGTNTDVDDQWRAEEQRQLLLNEMSHRVKNLFAVMGGVVTLSARSADTPQAMATTVSGRLNALAHAHKLIAPALSGNGMANQESTLGELVRATLAPHLDPTEPDGDRRAVIEGPEVAIGGEAVTSLALILHELATNAAKYGAFSSSEGRVHVTWSVKKGKLALSWQESGGPKVKGAPTREGFGSLLARRSAAGQLGGELAFEWKTEGLIVRFSAAAERLGTMNG